MSRLKLIFFYLIIENILAICKSTNKYEEFFIKTESLPVDLNFMPTLGNGHLGYTVFGDAIYMNGIYNGAHGDSRRARIPNWLNLSVSIVDGDGDVDDDNDNDNDAPKPATTKVQQHFEMNLRDGYFRYQQNMPTLGLKIEQRTYAHRFYNRALIYEFLVQRTETKEPLTLKLKQTPGKPSVAFNFTPLSVDNDGIIVESVHPKSENSRNGNSSTLTWKSLKGVTKIVEHELFQNDLKTIFIYLSENLENGKQLKMLTGEKELYYRFILTADENEENAWKEMRTIYSMNSADLLNTHSTEWHKFWNTFYIKIEDNLELSHVINAGMFYMASSLPSPNSSITNNLFYGLSPTGLGRGEKDSDYEGHSFWDTEIWMLPAVTQFSSKWTQELLRYRKNGLKAAKFYANSTGYKGARYPWESAYTGTEVTNPCCLEVAEFQIHISTDIILAMQHLYAVTKNTKWLCENDLEMINAIADFLTSRVTYNTMTAKYQVKNVMGPDEDHVNVTDSVYTNLSFKLALEFAIFAHEKCIGSPSPARWQEIAANMNILYDPVQNYHPEYENYKLGEIVKQADVILLGYPLQYQMNDCSTRLNDLQNYESVTRESGPAMTWSIFAINYLDINHTQKADLYMEKCYKNYVRDEFKVWSETTIGHSGAANFLTGIGGFLQAVINGYAGIRFYHKDTISIMEIRQRHILPNTKGLKIQGLFFADARFDLTVDSNGASKLVCLSMKNTNLELTIGLEKYQIHKGFSIDLNDAPIYVTTMETLRRRPSKTSARF